MPELFNDSLYKRSGNWVLGTNTLFSQHFPLYGWGRTAQGAFGVVYMTTYGGACWKLCIIHQISYIHADHLQFTITSQKEMPNQEFAEEIAKAVVDLYGLHTEQVKVML
jgi:carnitine O-acetyltransferase